MEPSDLARRGEGCGDGLLCVDADGRLTFANAAARRLLGLRNDASPDRWFSELCLLHVDRDERLTAAEFAPNRAGRTSEEVEQRARVHTADAPGGRLVRMRAWPVPGVTSTGSVTMIEAVEHPPAAEGAGSGEQRAVAYIELLRVTTAVANEAGALDDALAVVLRAVCAAAEWSVGQAHLVCDFPPRFVLAHVAHLADPERHRAFREATERVVLGLGDGLLGRVRAAGAPVFVADLRADSGFFRLREAEEAGLYAAFAFPIFVRNEVVGVVELFAAEHAAPSAELLDTLVQIGTLLGRVVERERAKAREAFFHAIIDHVGDPIFVKDRSLRWVVLNRAFTELVGFPHDVMIGKSDPDFFPPEQAEFFHAKDREMFSSGSRVTVEEEPITDAGGRFHWLATTKVPLRSPSGEVTHLVGIIHDITRLKSVEADLKLRNEELAAEVRQHEAAEERLRAVNRDLEGFCRSVSHDLRTPLRAIDGYSSVLLREHAPALDEAGIRALGRIRKNVQRMARLIDDLLQLSRVARAPLTRQRVDLGALAAEVIAERRRDEPGRRVSFTAARDLVVCADLRLTRLLLENLLGNAWKFTSVRPEAHIELSRSGDAFCIRDDGAGFEMSHAAMLFKPFCRLHRDEEFPGTGVGLATVQRIVERHGGRVWAEGGVDRGAAVWFTLVPTTARAALDPAAADPAAADPAAADLAPTDP